MADLGQIGSYAGGGLLGGGVYNYFKTKGEREKAQSDWEKAQAAMSPESIEARGEKFTQKTLGDLARGRQYGQELYKTPLYELGREQISPEYQDILQRLKKQSYGLQAPESEAMRQQLMGSVRQQQTAAQAMAARMAQRSGLRGQAIAAQSQQAAAQAQQARALANQQNFLQNIEAQRQGLAAYMSGYGGVEQMAARRASEKESAINQWGAIMARMVAEDRARAATQAAQEAAAAQQAKESQRKGILGYALDPIVGGLFG